MQSLRYAYNVIEILNRTGVGSIYHHGDSFFIPKSDGTPLARISSTSILVNQAELNSRITPCKSSKLSYKIEPDVLSAFISELSSASELTLNHLGINYYCTDLDAEISAIKKLLGANKLYEESSENATTKWLFIGNVEKPSEPLFELVLNERKKPTLSSWTPHIQIDIDTTLPHERLLKVINKHLGDDWVKWRIDIENWGTPLVIGRMCSIGGLKVYLGIGTNKRGREWHRKKGLRQL